MWRASWLRRPRAARQVPAKSRTLGLEALEDRRLLSAGGLDLTFGPFGYTPTSLDGRTLNASSIAIQADQKVIIGGAISSATGGATSVEVALERLNPDGSLDRTFGAGGMVPTSFTGQGLPSGTYDPGLALALQSDAKIVVAGSTATSSGNQFFVERFNANGTLDTTFAGSGSEVINFGSGTSEARALAITRGGEILVVGVQNNGRSGFALALLQTDGTVDTTFGPNGTGLVVTYFSLGSQGSAPPPPGPTINASATAVLIQGDGSFYVAGMATTLGPQPPSGPPPVDTGFALARYSANGNLDGTFGTGGEVSTDLQGLDTATSLVVQSDGMIVLGGSAAGTKFGLVRYQTTGSRDPNFGSGGIVTTGAFPGQSRINGIAVQSDGKIVAGGVAGASTVTGSLNGQSTRFALARYNSAGSLDTTFGKSGIATTSIGAQADAIVGIALDKEGRIVAAGNMEDATGKSAFVVARYLVQNDVGDLNQRFLAQLYRDLLRRDIDPAGMAGFGSLLDQDKAGRLDVARIIEASPEFKTVEVTDIYREFLGRAPEQSGLQGWVAFLLNGGSATQVETLVAGSSEFFQNAGGSNTTFLEALYRVALDRAVDPIGAQGFGSALTSGMPRTTVAELVFTSPESEQDLIGSFYLRSLHRQADTDGLNSFVAALQRGTRQEEIRALIVSSDEYLQIL